MQRDLACRRFFGKISFLLFVVAVIRLLVIFFLFITMAQIFISDDAKKQILNCTIISVKPPDDIIKASSACLSGISQVGRPLTLPALPYDYNALERKCEEN
jgi:hypothetical protein